MPSGQVGLPLRMVPRPFRIVRLTFRISRATLPYSYENLPEGSNYLLFGCGNPNDKIHYFGKRRRIMSKEAEKKTAAHKSFSYLFPVLSHKEF